MGDTDYYIPAAALAVTFLFKLPALVRRWRNAMVRAVSGLILMAGAGFAFAAPPTIAVVNRVTGVPNVSAPLVYAILSVFNTCCIALLVYWREGLDRQVQRRVRSWFAACAVVIALIAGFFVLGETPDERVRDFDTYYATAPFIRESLVVYLTWHIVIGTVVPALCWRWSRIVDGWLRAGLLTLVAGFTLSTAFGLVKAAAVIARWAGTDLDFLSTDVAPPLASVGAVLTTLGFLLPQGERLAARWTDCQTFRAMRPLWHDLRTSTVDPVPPVTTAWRTRLNARLADRETDIHDALLTLAPYCDPATLDASRRQALAAGRSEDEAWAFAAAVMIDSAVAHRAAAPHDVGDDAHQAGTAALSSVFAAGAQGIAQVSRHYAALPTSRIGRPIHDAAAPESSTR
ncbi:MAB_1171c family putative transporter [Streptomyces sp. 12297]